MSTTARHTIEQDGYRVEITATGGEYEWEGYHGARYIAGGIVRADSLDGARQDIASRIRNPRLRTTCETGPVSSGS
jgi:hypothetical protein